jgi:hypothetical protein
MLDASEEKVSDTETRLDYSPHLLLKQHAHQTSIQKSPARNTAQTALYQTSFYEPNTVKFSASTSFYLNITH